MGKASHNTISMLIGGDVAPRGPDTIAAFCRGDAVSLFTNMLPVLKCVDFSMVNLEGPFASKPKPILKTGNNFRFPSDTINGLIAANVRGLILANNHILDHGQNALNETLALCDRANIIPIGAGKNLVEAGKPHIFQTKGLRVALLAMADTEFSIAGDNSYGANPLDLINYVGTVSRLRGESDKLVVLIHGGAEHYPYPSPRMQKMSRFMVDQGANAVFWQHSHIPGCLEHYHGAPIVYGQGNLIADRPGFKVFDPDWHKGFICVLKLTNNNVTLEMIPYMQSFNRLGARKMTDSEKIKFQSDFDWRSGNILEKEFVKTKWEEFCISRKETYVSILKGYGPFLTRINKRIGFGGKLYSQESLTALLNVVRCQIHREQLETILQLLSYNR